MNRIQRRICPNIKKHGFDFADAEELFRTVLIVDPDTREDYGEKRWTGIGVIRGCAAHVVFTERPPGDHSYHFTKKGNSS